LLSTMLRASYGVVSDTIRCVFSVSGFSRISFIPSSLPTLFRSLSMAATWRSLGAQGEGLVQVRDKGFLAT
jgi:hypothetical protein